jgi:hypothetical protein
MPMTPTASKHTQRGIAEKRASKPTSKPIQVNDKARKDHNRTGIQHIAPKPSGLGHRRCHGERRRIPSATVHMSMPSTLQGGIV